MLAYVAVTDKDWYRFLSARPDLEEVNFWQPGGSRLFGRLKPGEPFLFKLHYPDNAIVGGGFFTHASLLPSPLAWETFGEKNGAASYEDMRARIERYRHVPPDTHAQYKIGCIILQEPFFLAERDWIAAPSDFKRQTVQGKAYDLTTREGQLLWRAVLERYKGLRVSGVGEPKRTEIPLDWRERPVRQRLGQGAFRILITDVYERRCAVTSEKALPTLQAAHIRPVTEGGGHRVENGLLLRSDIHALFDQGYVTITPDLNFLASRRAFIQPVHEFRDEGIRDPKPPIEHVALFDEAQRAWDHSKTADFLRRRKGVPDFAYSEPEFLISCMDRHEDWAVVVCLVGGGQEIHTGEAGISEWIESLNRSFPDWHIYISSRLTDSEYGAGRVLDLIRSRPHVVTKDELHLSVSMRSFRAENVSRLVKELLDLEVEAACRTLSELREKYPIVITRDLMKAKRWLRTQARGSERYGVVVSSQAERLKPHAIDVKSPVDPIHWFLDGKEDVRSSYYLEDVATEFHIQGLELDWACVTWDADFRHTPDGWQHWSFSGDRWNRINKAERRLYLKNAYRVLLTRARQGMVIVVPPGDSDDPTRKPEFYDPTFQYLGAVGFLTI